MARIDLVAARLTDCGPIASRMRAADRIECAALGRTPKEGLRIGFRMSLKPLTVLIDGRPEAMMGAVPVSLIGGTGLVWFLATDVVGDHARVFALLGPRIVADWLSTFRELSNIVAVENTKAIRLLRHLGFMVGGKLEFHRGCAFVPFKLERGRISTPAPLSCHA